MAIFRRLRALDRAEAPAAVGGRRPAPGPGALFGPIAATLVAAATLAALLPSTAARAGSALRSMPSDPARAEAILEGDVPQLTATLLVSESSPARVGVLFEMEPGWHLYWRNPGETGVAPELAFDADGHAIGALAWPVPQIFREADDLFTTYGYEGRVLLSAPLERVAVGAATAAPTGSVRARVNVLVCRTQCVPASFALETPLAKPSSETVRETRDALFEESASRVPPPAEALGWTFNAAWTGGSPALEAASSLVLSLEPCATGTSKTTGTTVAANEKRTTSCVEPNATEPDLGFLPFESEAFELEREEAPASESAGSSRIALTLAATRVEAGPDRLKGIVALRDATGRLRHAEIDVPIRERAAIAAALQAPDAGDRAEGGAPVAWLRAILLALLGGLILNGMPCVLPVLAIKVVSIADLAERDANEVRLHGLAYTAGVLGSMLALAALVVGLRSAGHAVGWGFQFQEPLFVAAIAALLVAFALNLFGVFEIELGQGRLAAVGQDATGISRSVFEGLLAVVLATPCTAPFLGTAVGFAFTSSGLGIVAIFAAIGTGLAAPFLLVSFFPALARFVPRSGPWMLTLRAGLGFCLLATVIWLLWIVGQSGGTDAVIALVAALLFLAFLLWIFGRMQPMRSAWLGRASAFAITLLAFVSFNLIDFERVEAAPSAGSTVGDASGPESDGFLAYDETAVRETLARGVPVFVVFTADWCITCKVNERTVLDRPAVREALARNGFALYRADWTRRDETIRAKLAEFGRAGVPLYLVYDAATPDRPRVLSELLSQEAVIGALEAVSEAVRI